jgi:hypothetical protein
MSVNGLGSSYGGAYSSANSTRVSALGLSASSDTTKAHSSAVTNSSNSVVVNISDNGRAASAQATELLSFEDVGMAARAKLDALIQQTAQKAGISPQSVNVQAIQVADYSGFSDQELAAISLNSSKNFSVAEKDEAGAVLNARVAASLEPYRAATNAGDRRGHAMAINALYDKMSPEVRNALGWTPTMMAANNKMLNGDEERFGKLEFAGIFSQLQTAALHGGLSLS